MRRRKSASVTPAGLLGFILECQQVMALRLIRLANGDPGLRETQRMFAEKASALGAAQLAAGSTMLHDPIRAADRAFGVYRAAVSANRRRLSR